jgi:hypothetical protein
VPTLPGTDKYFFQTYFKRWYCTKDWLAKVFRKENTGDKKSTVSGACVAILRHECRCFETV